LNFKDGVPGDITTAAAVVNAIPRLVELSPDFKTMLDMPPIRFYGNIANDSRKERIS
jgi:hypothetical protein